MERISERDVCPVTGHCQMRRYRLEPVQAGRLRRANALLNSTGVGHHRVSPALGSGLFTRVKVVTGTANIKAASLWRGGNSAAVRALFMLARWSSLAAHKKN